MLAMAEVTNEEIDRKTAAPNRNGVPLADETPEELPALLAIAVGIAILVITLVWPSIRDRGIEVSAGEPEVAAAAEVEEEPEPVEEEVEPEPVAEGPDIPRFESELAVAGLALSADGNVVFAEGVVPDDATRDGIITYLSGQPNVDAVNADNLIVEAPPAAAATVNATAAQVSIVLEGTVPDEATRDEIGVRAIAVYSEAQVDNQIEVDPSVTPPVTLNLAGSMTDEVLFNQVSGAFDGVNGVEIGQNTLTLEESSDAEAALNALEPIEFASGSALVTPESEAILDQAAEVLAANPDVAVEIGGHTDSRGGDESNQSLSQSRAETVRDALATRGVTNELTAVGFGERRLKVSPDEDDPEAQQTNRRIEYRVTN